MQLKDGSLLQNGKYRTMRVLGQGGFGITYLAIDYRLGRRVAIKEFFPKDFCGRGNTSNLTLGTQNNAETVAKLKERFLKEARNITKLDHPGIVKIHDVFEENNTAYSVMDYIEGENLNEMVNRNGPLSEAKAVEYIRKVGDALDYIHSRKMTHFDVKPANIVVRCSDDWPILIDFGLSKQYDIHGDATSTLMQGVSNGYSPIELYNYGAIASFSPQTDIYSLGATLYYLLTAKIPPVAVSVMEEGLFLPPFISTSIKEAITEAMQSARNSRPAHVTTFCESLGRHAGASSSNQSHSKEGDNDESTIYQQSESERKSNTNWKFPGVNYFRASKTKLLVGDSVILSWSTSFADQVFLEYFPNGSKQLVDNTGSVKIDLSHKGKYQFRLKAINNYAEDSHCLNLDVYETYSEYIQNLKESGTQSDGKNSKRENRITYILPFIVIGVLFTSLSYYYFSGNTKFSSENSSQAYSVEPEAIAVELEPAKSDSVVTFDTKPSVNNSTNKNNNSYNKNDIRNIVELFLTRESWNCLEAYNSMLLSEGMELFDSNFGSYVVGYEMPLNANGKPLLKNQSGNPQEWTVCLYGPGAYVNAIEFSTLVLYASLDDVARKMAKSLNASFVRQLDSDYGLTSVFLYNLRGKRLAILCSRGAHGGTITAIIGDKAEIDSWASQQL